MAGSFSKVKLLSDLVANGVSLAISRRGYASAASNGALSSVVRGGGRSGMVKKGEEKASETSSWVPDPVTGYYRPENRAAEIDVVDLREMLLTRKITHN
ncbi:hypothetical protein HHK36_026541 [Tetracentron sinense]|uniref:Uncharacterized protein n=1 Tax=Tetracentron sinense TaxID=13715 RepID=A0A834YG83_TETSI|nr:hypothetical protein HHK36_026541 [Tetracentron sinense]